MLNKILTLFFILTVPTSALAGPAWQNHTYVKGVQALHNGGIILYLPPGSDTACLEGGKLFYVIPGQNGVTAEGVKNILTVALVAHSTGKQVSVYYDNADPHCYVKQLYVSSDI